MTDENGHCITTCQIHDDTRKTLTTHAKILNGDDKEGGLVTAVNLILEKVLKLEKMIYGMIGIILAGVLVAIGKLILAHGGK